MFLSQMFTPKPSVSVLFGVLARVISFLKLQYQIKHKFTYIKGIILCIYLFIHAWNISERFLMNWSQYLQNCISRRKVDQRFNLHSLSFDLLKLMTCSSITYWKMNSNIFLTNYSKYTYFWYSNFTSRNLSNKYS